MEIPVSFQLPANPLAYNRNASASVDNLPKNGNLPMEARGIPNTG